MKFGNKHPSVLKKLFVRGAGKNLSVAVIAIIVKSVLASKPNRCFHVLYARTREEGKTMSSVIMLSSIEMKISM